MKLVYLFLFLVAQVAGFEHQKKPDPTTKPDGRHLRTVPDRELHADSWTYPPVKKTYPPVEGKGGGWGPWGPSKGSKSKSAKSPKSAKSKSAKSHWAPSKGKGSAKAPKSKGSKGKGKGAPKGKGKGAPKGKGKGAPKGKGKGAPKGKGKGAPEGKGKGAPEGKGKGAPEGKGKGGGYSKGGPGKGPSPSGKGGPPPSGKGGPAGCMVLPVVFNSDDIIAGEYTNAVGFGLNSVPFFDAATGQQLGVYSDFSTEIPGSDECISTGAFSFGQNNTSGNYDSQINLAFTCTSESNSIVGGNGRYACASGFEKFAFEDQGVLGTELYICDLCPHH